MVQGMESLLLSSENPRRLAEFYRDVVGLDLVMEMIMGDDGEEAFAFSMGTCGLFINPHSEVNGKAKEPQRVMMNFLVDDIEAMAAEFEEKDVPLVQEIYHVENYGLIATYEDPDGNYFQLVQIREKPSTEVSAAN